MERIRYMEAGGAARTMGEAHGEMWRGEIRDFTERRIEHAREFVARYAQGRRIGRDDVLDAAGAVLAAHRSYDAGVWEEFEGIARAAGIGPAELLACNGLTDLRDWLLLRNPDGSVATDVAPPGSIDALRPSSGEISENGRHGREDTDGCTSFVSSAEAAGGSPLLGQTWDMHPEARHFLLVQRRKPAEGPASLVLTTVGCLPLIGLNEHGVCVGTNNLVPTDVRIGVSYLFTIGRALRARTAAAAAETIGATVRLSGHNFVIADRSVGLNLETTARQSVLLRASEDERGEGVHVHANHYAAERLRSYACEAIDLAGSRWREEHLYAGFRRASHPIDTDKCWALLSDATRGDGAVCNEDYDGAYGLAATAATAVIDPAAGVMLACAGGGRLGRRERFALAS